MSPKRQGLSNTEELVRSFEMADGVDKSELESDRPHLAPEQGGITL